MSSDKNLQSFIQNLKPGQFIEKLGDVISNIVAIKDTQGKYVYVNTAFLNSLQITKDKIIGYDDTAIFGAELARVYMDDDQKVLQNIIPSLRTTELVTYRPGVVRWHSTYKFPLFDQHNQIAGLMLISSLLENRQNFSTPEPMETIGEVVCYTDNSPQIQKALNRAISKAVNYIYANPSKTIRITDLIQLTGVSVSSLERAFNQNFNCSPAKFITQTKMSIACELLANPIYSIAQVGEMSSYPDPVIFSRVFKREMKINPLKYRQSL